MCLNVGTPLLSIVRKEEGGNRRRHDEAKWAERRKTLEKGHEGADEGYRERNRVRGWDKRSFSAAVKLPLGSLTGKDE